MWLVSEGLVKLRIEKILGIARKMNMLLTLKS
jgi:hypothetical protein